LRSEGSVVVDRVSAGYGPVRVLRELSLEVHPGEVVSVIGANGAGKSTLLRAISGRISLSSGSVHYAGRSMAQLSPAEICRAGIGHAPEGRQLFSSLTVRENLQLGLYALPRHERRAHAAAQLELVHSLFPILDTFAHRQAGMLSGGQQQMLSLARALMTRPSILLLDEPSMGLAPGPVADIKAAVKQLSQEGMAVLLIEQVVGLALAMSSRAYILRGGRVSASGSSAELLQKPDLLHSAYFGIEDVPATGTPGAEQ